MTEIFIMLVLISIKHFLADFVWQFLYMIEQKGTYGAIGGIHHSLLHGALTFFVIIWFVPFWPAVGLACLDSIIHYHVDWAKSNLSAKLLPTDQKFWVWFGVDQLLHYLTYIIIIGIIVL